MYLQGSDVLQELLLVPRQLSSLQLCSLQRCVPLLQLLYLPFELLFLLQPPDGQPAFPGCRNADDELLGTMQKRRHNPLSMCCRQALRMPRCWQDANLIGESCADLLKGLRQRMCSFLLLHKLAAHTVVNSLAGSIVPRQKEGVGLCHKGEEVVLSVLAVVEHGLAHLLLRPNTASQSLGQAASCEWGT